MEIIKYAAFEAVEREKFALLFNAVQHIDWLSRVELDSIRMADKNQRFVLDELEHIKKTLSKIISQTKSSDTKSWASGLYIVVATACEKLVL